MVHPQISLQARIFFAMILLVLVASVLIAGVTIYQYREQSNRYHQQRLERKESQLQTSIDYILTQTPYETEEVFLDSIFAETIFQIADVQNINFRVYNLSGKLINSTQFPLESDATQISEQVLSRLKLSTEGHFIERKSIEGEQYRSSYSYIFANNQSPIGILNLPYYDDDSLSSMELKNFLIRLVQVYLLMLTIAILLAYAVVKYITQFLETISEKITLTDFNKTNEKITVSGAGKEITNLIQAYNNMVDQLQESAVKLAKGEREQAWREMAKQVAHEIQNPLTPMRLSVQSFERNFNLNDSDATQKIADFSNTLIQQIDTMSTIASAFSTFAEMPAQKSETIEVVEITRLALDIFKEKNIHFHTSSKKVFVELDRTHLIRIINNLVKNAVQACQEVKEAKIQVELTQKNNWVCIAVTDNGIGIKDSESHKIFEPNFTTKSSGMGLGLGMVKNIVHSCGGTIDFSSIPNEKTSFKVCFPIKLMNV